MEGLCKCRAFQLQCDIDWPWPRGLDYAPLDQDSVPDDAPIVVVQHGLTGGVSIATHLFRQELTAPIKVPMRPMFELSLLALARLYRREVWVIEELWSTTAVVSTVWLDSHVWLSPLGAGVPITSQKLYSAGATDDTRSALAFIQSQYPKARLLGMGFSLGSNVITRYLGEEMDKARLNSACVMACVSAPARYTNHTLNLLHDSSLGTSWITTTGTLLSLECYLLLLQLILLQTRQLIYWYTYLLERNGWKSPKAPPSTLRQHHVWPHQHRRRRRKARTLPQ